MIITNIQAENILRYATLHLQNLPASGVIAISGENEAGKSAIGEIICFALFGRTFSLDPTHILKVIRWGEAHCSVKMTFQQDNEQYQLSRFLDNEGNHSAKLVVSRTEQTLASGFQSVENAIHTLIGYDFDGFIHSFYLAQREITTPHPRSDIIKIMAGIASLEGVMKEIKNDISTDREEILATEQRMSEINAELQSLSFDKEHLRTLRKQSITDNDFLTELQRQTTGLEQASRRYTAALSSIDSTRIVAGITLLLRNLLLFLALVVAGSGIFLMWFFDSNVVQHWIDMLSRWSQPHGESLQWLLPYGFAGFLLLFSFLWIVDSLLKQRIQRLEGERLTLANILRKVQQIATAYHATSPNETDIPTPLLPEAHTIECPVDDEAIRILQRIVDNIASSMQIENIVSRSTTWLYTLTGQYRKILLNLDLAITDEERKLRAVQHLEGMGDKLRSGIEEYRTRIATRHLAHELLHGACGRIVQRFNREIRESVGEILPMFTENRYQYLHIDQDLNVKIFSMEKQDFMDLEEVSSGTQRQTMLALRIALAQRLLEQTRGKPQFLFLDEPFAFFDETRTRRAFGVLPTLTGNLKQIWVVAQSFPEDTQSFFARQVECVRDSKKRDG